MPNAPLLTADYVRHWARQTPEHPALRWGDQHLTYRELDERSSRVAQALAAEGVGAGDRVAFLDKNGPEQAELFFGAAKLNAVPCPVNFRLAPAEIAVIVADSQAKLFAVGAEFVPQVDKVAGDLPGTEIIAIGDAQGHRSFSRWRDEHPADDPQVAQSPQDVAYQLYSSGTTGRPKGVQLTQANLAAGLSLYPWLLGIGPDAVVMVAMPLYHIGGGGWLLAGHAVGATNVIVRDAVPSDLVALIPAAGITHTFLVPAVLQFMLAVPGAAAQDYSSLQNILYGASPISEKVLTASIETFQCGFVQAYGLTESTGTVAYLPEADHQPDGPNRQRLRSVGRPIPGTEMRIADPASGRDVKQGEVGEIWIKGPTVMKGYWNLPDATAASIDAEGWLRSGDAGYHDADGYIYVHDRVKDMIVSGGENVYPAEVENVIMSHPQVADVAVIGVPSETWGETPLAVVVRTAGSSLTEGELLAYCRERLAGFKCPSGVDWAEQLPRNPSGKIVKKDLRAPYWEGRTRLVG